MKTDLFDYHLPMGNIAQRPLARRDASRLLVLDRKTGRVDHSQVRNLSQWLLPNDLMVVNQTKVIPARLFATKPETGAKLEIFLLRPALGETGDEWEVLISPAKRIKGVVILKLEPKGEVAVLESLGEGHFLVRFNRVGNFRNFLKKHGHIPLPPYINRKDDSADRERYQTLFAKKEGSVAAPTAGLHFTKALLGSLRKKGIDQTSVTLHVGLGTFLPVASDDLEEHVMHPERIEVPPSTVSAHQKTRKRNGRVVAIGTTVVRTLEAMAQPDGTLRAGVDETRLFITPGYTFKAVDVIFTNFHQPRSTLLALICAFAGRERVLAAYEEAIREGYRFLSYGDAMLIL
jgi:S-adenosylmethionine:tRNA ribosyltransferase-isomerase